MVPDRMASCRRAAQEALPTWHATLAHSLTYQLTVRAVGGATKGSPLGRTTSAEGRTSGFFRGGPSCRLIRTATLLLLVLMVLVAVVWFGGADAVDRWGHAHALRLRSPRTVTWALAVTTAGNHWTALAVTSAAALFVAMTSSSGRWRAAAILVVGVWTTIGVRLVVADAVGRSRPPAGDWAGAAAGFAFPSGHTTAATVSAAVVAWSLSSKVDGVTRRRAIWALGVLFAAGVGWSRVWLGVHWPTDVAGAWCLGALGALLTCRAAQAQFRHRQQSPHDHASTGPESSRP